MSSISNGNSTREDEPRTRRLTWRPAAILLLLAAALVISYRWAVPAVRAGQAEQRQADLALAGLAAEEVEMAALDGLGMDAGYLADLLTPLVHSEPTLAYVRIRDAAGTPVCVVAQEGVDEVHVPAPATRDAHADGEWLSGISHLQELVRTQREISDLLAAAAERGGLPAAQRNSLYVLQDDALQLAETRIGRFPRLAMARPPMRAVLDAVTADAAEALTRAADSSADAEEVIARVLEGERAQRDRLARLPDAVAQAAPPAASWPGHLWPQLRGRRITIPLFIPAIDERALAPAGTVEVVFYDHPGDTLTAAIPWACLAMACLALALMLARPRRKTPLSGTTRGE